GITCPTWAKSDPWDAPAGDRTGQGFNGANNGSETRASALTGHPRSRTGGGEGQAMRVLAIDTALEACSAAVLDTSSGITASETLAMTRGHAEAVMPLIARVMSEAVIEFADLDRIAVTTGPGSFTGLRVGISATRGIALAAGKPAVGLSTLAGFAAPLIADDDITHAVGPSDAPQDQVYLQVFGSGGRTLVAPRVASVRDAARAAMTARARIIGSAANKVAAAWPKGAEPPLSVEQRGAPDIDWIARLGAAAAED